MTSEWAAMAQMREWEAQAQPRSKERPMTDALTGTYHNLAAELSRHAAHPRYVELLQALQLLAQQELARVFLARPCLPGCGVCDASPAQPAFSTPQPPNSAPTPDKPL